MVSEEIGCSQVSIYHWRKLYLKKGTIALVNKKRKVPQNKLTQDNKSSNQEINDLKKQIFEMQFEIDLMKEIYEVLKKDRGVDWMNLKNPEKAAIIDAMRKKYQLPMLLKRLRIAKSSYYYQKCLMSAKGKYDDLKPLIKEIFENNYKVYGYRRVHAVLVRTGITLSQKVVLKLMKSENLNVEFKKTKSYSSYRGNITPPVENVIERDFKAMQPNEKWLTDITEFAIPAGKVYLSPIVDCFDGILPAWTIRVNPNAELVNTMLEKAFMKLDEDEHPIVHSDQGVHYQWHGWISLMNKAKLIRSMSKKGCSPDNSACEGLFGRIKNEMFYNRDWRGVSIEQFIIILNDYLIWYNEKRIKASLGYLSPVEYRLKLGYSF